MARARKPAMTAARKRVAGELVTALLGAIFGAELFEAGDEEALIGGVNLHG